MKRRACRRSAALRCDLRILPQALPNMPCRQFVEQFFQCSECSQHFGAMAAEEAALAVTTQRDAVLWAWRAHNIVSKPFLQLHNDDLSPPPTPTAVSAA